MNALDTPQLVAVAAALGWASGLRLYAVLFLVGLAGTLGWVELPTGLLLLEHPLMLTASGLMLAVEFLADKIPGVDTLWDVLHTLLRIPAGAALAATSHFAPRHRSRLVLQDVLSTSCGSHTEST
jgi:hypothetical protein